MANIGTGKWTTAHLVMPYGIVVAHHARLNDKAVYVMKHMKGVVEIQKFTKGADGIDKVELYFEGSVRAAKEVAQKWLRGV